VEALKERRADGTALTGTLDHKQTAIDLTALFDQLSQVFEPGENADVN
jgi:hypothetical protein